MLDWHSCQLVDNHIRLLSTRNKISIIIIITVAVVFVIAVGVFVVVIYLVR